MQVRKYLGVAAAVTLALASLTACKEFREPKTSSIPQTNVQDVEAIAYLTPTEGNNVNGVVTFIETPQGLRVIAEITGLTPGEHGFHIHEKGDCSAPDAKSAGEHYNPDQKPHGSPDNGDHHIGDLGNITADRSGIARHDRVYPISLKGDHGILGKSVIIHSQADDFKTQPSGNAGSRLACGVIQMKTENRKNAH